MKKSIMLNGVWAALIIAMIVLWFVPIPFKTSALVLLGVSGSLLGRTL